MLKLSLWGTETGLRLLCVINLRDFFKAYFEHAKLLFYMSSRCRSPFNVFLVINHFISHTFLSVLSQAAADTVQMWSLICYFILHLDLISIQCD